MYPRNINQTTSVQVGLDPYLEPMYQPLVFDEQCNLVVKSDDVRFCSVGYSGTPGVKCASEVDIDTFIQSANKLKLNDNQLPASILYYLVVSATPGLSQKLRDTYGRPALSYLVDTITRTRQTPYDRLLEVCAGTGLIAFLKHLNANEKPPNYKPTPLALIAAARRGDLSCIQYLHQEGYPWTDQYTHDVFSVSCILAMKGHLDCLKYAVENDCPIDSTSCAEAAEGGQYDCLQYLHQQGEFMCEQTCQNAVYHGYVDCLEYIIKHTKPKHFTTVFTTDTSATAAGCGQLECLKMLHEAGCPWDERTPMAAADEGNLDCLRYAFEHGCPWDEQTPEFAARKGRLDCLKYALMNQCPVDISTCNMAAEFGPLVSLKCAHEHGCPWDADTMARAAWCGRLEYIKYMHENGCPWDESACALAADESEYECLVYLHENGCPWDERTAVNAQRSVHKDSDKCLRYVIEHGLSCPILTMHQLTRYIRNKFADAITNRDITVTSRLRRWFWGILYLIMTISISQNQKPTIII